MFSKSEWNILAIKLIYVWEVELQIYSYFLVTNAAPKFQSTLTSSKTQRFIAFSHPHWLRLSNKITARAFSRICFQREVLASSQFLLHEDAFLTKMRLLPSSVNSFSSMPCCQVKKSKSIFVFCVCMRCRLEMRSEPSTSTWERLFPPWTANRFLLQAFYLKTVNVLGSNKTKTTSQYAAHFELLEEKLHFCIDWMPPNSSSATFRF